MNSVYIHVRSISLPSRLHPNSLKIEADLTKLKSWDFSSSASHTNSIQAETIQLGLTKLAELFICVEELTHPPQNQQAHPQQHLNQVEKVLDRSLELVDVCCTARELFLGMQERIRDLQSALRRRGKDSSTIESNIQAYMSFRKRTKKEVTKSLATLKRLESNSLSFPTMEEEQHLSHVVEVIREAHAIAVTMFRSVMLFFSPLAMKTDIVGWSMISKLIRSGLLASDKGDKFFNEIGKVDIAVSSIHGQMRKNNETKFDVQQVQERLETLDVSIHDIEAKLDCLFRCLIQNRVSLLNLVTP